MKQLEDRIKDRLEGYQSSLPEGDLAEFKALLDATAVAGKKRTPAYLAWLAPVAVAAGLAMFFIFGHGPQQDIIRVVEGDTLMADVAEAAETESAEQVVMVQTTPSGERRIKHPVATEPVNDLPDETDPEPAVDEPFSAEQTGHDQQVGNTGQKVEQKRDAPFLPSDSYNRKPVSVKVGRTAAGVVGGAGVVALAGMLPTLVMKNDYNMGSEIVNPGEIMTDPEPPVDRRTWNDTYHMPLRAGISVRVPLAERWSLTTGLDYSWYASELEYSLSGIHDQNAHYLGVPLRADFTIARNRWMDVYVGAGGSVDFCVAASDAGHKTAGDGVGFSLTGAGGIQFNINNNLGLFLDPALSWDMTSGNRILETYRSEHPFMFAVSTGLRLTVPTKRK